jgi:integrase
VRSLWRHDLFAGGDLMPRGKREGSIFKDARGYWTATVELPAGTDGKRRRKTIRSRDKKTVLVKLQALQAELKARGDLPSAEITVEGWFTYWLDNIVAETVRPTTAMNYRNIFKNHVKPAIGTMKLGNVKAEHLRRVTDRMSDELGLAPSSVLKTHRVMAASFKSAVRENRVGRSPMEHMLAPRKSHPELEVLTLEETIRVLEHVSHTPMGARWAVSLLTGARRGEVLGLTADRVTDVLDFSWQLVRIVGASKSEPVAPKDFEYKRVKGGLFLVRPKSKSGQRIMPLVDPLKSILERHMAENPPGPSGLIFLEEGRPIGPERDTRAWQRVFAETGINKNIRLHDLRHGFADLLFSAGVPEDILIDMMGHSTIAMSRAYRSRSDPARALAAAKAVSAQFALPLRINETDAA